MLSQFACLKNQKASRPATLASLYCPPTPPPTPQPLPPQVSCGCTLSVIPLRAGSAYLPAFFTPTGYTPYMDYVSW